MLKADFHLHVQGDPRHHLKHTAQQLIDHASKLNFQVLAITNHDQVFYSPELADYAQSKNIFLIPAAEKTLAGKEVLLYNVTQKDIDQLKTFDDLKKLKQKKDILIIAPHPFFLLPSCLGNQLEKHLGLFDAIEYSHFHHKFINRNQKAVKLAQKYQKPLIGTSDCHALFQFNHTYTLVDSKPDQNSIFQAIKNQKCHFVTQALSTKDFLKVPFVSLFNRRITDL